jgi:ribosomal protein L31E
MPEDETERLIAASLERHTKADPARIARAILEELWEAGYDVVRRPNIIPIRRNPGEDHADE